VKVLPRVTWPIRARRKKKRFEKIETKLDDGVLLVEGVKRVSQMADGLGGEFTYCTWAIR
jgi:adenine-specific DNA-methyltransferase